MLRTYALFLIALLTVINAQAYQLAPIGSEFEARLTNEKENSLIRAAGKVGVLLKAPVHEEITQLAFECLVDAENLITDKICAHADKPFATVFVIYGVRWNDLPPFKLNPEQGNCNHLGLNFCKQTQTVYFSTQPMCWYCLFKAAEKTALKSKITGCDVKAGNTVGNLMARSHFGDLQFIHSMATESSQTAFVTQAKILGWGEFTWNVATKKIAPTTFLRDIQIPVIQEHFGCSGWRVQDLYLMGRLDQKQKLIQQIHQIAFGSLLHTVQDSFAKAHTSRETEAKKENCPNTDIARPKRISEFHTYSAQDSHLHDAQDERSALLGERANEEWPQAVVASRELVKLFKSNKEWDTAQHYIKCLFEIVENPNIASAGEDFKRK